MTRLLITFAVASGLMLCSAAAAEHHCGMV